MRYSDIIGIVALILEYCLYLYVFSKIKGEKFSKKIITLFILLELFRSFTLGGSQTLILLPLEFYFIDIYLLKSQNRSKSFFYAIYTFYFVFTVHTFIDLAFQEFISEVILNRFFTNFWLLSTILTCLAHKWLFKFVKLDTSALKDDDDFILDKIINPLNRGLGGATIILLAVHYLEMFVNYGTVSQYTKQLVFAYVFMIVSVVILLQNKIAAYKEEIFQREKEEQYRRLDLYTAEIQNLYQTVRGFKHDYKNMLISLRETIDSGDLNNIQELYYSILDKANISLSQGEGVDDLARLESPALKSVLYQKLQEARDLGIQVHFEIKDEVKGLQIELLDLVRIVSILLDNSIEAAVETPNPEIFLAFVKRNDGYILHVKNSTLSDDIKLNKIYRPGYSTKGSGRGMGLFNVSQIISRYPDLSLQTDIEHSFFTQVMYIGG